MVRQRGFVKPIMAGAQYLLIYRVNSRYCFWYISGWTWLAILQVGFAFLEYHTGRKECS